MATHRDFNAYILVLNLGQLFKDNIKKVEVIFYSAYLK